MVRLLKPIIKGEQNNKQRKEIVRLKDLNFMLRDLTLGYPTWFSVPSWAVKTVMPFPKGDQVVVIHAFVRFREA